ncbi:hypothetical protein ORM60_26475 [Bacillus cereus]|uniref:hypothetical protein n=1 Tax=Bacillus cereus TaxID=1396 RepID=UPI002AC25DFD|nr:hypothetical protein [Bacillus cereus]MDZ4492036.1 hypothetical protein [Bacillus cereus]
MKLILFTISNEQIKEQLSKLQTKVESLETVKDVQDKIISTKDSQITFLQGEISNITSWVTWGAGIVITLASAAFIFIKLLESKAKKKIEEAESTLQAATQQLAQIEIAKQETETNLTESNSRIERLDRLIDKSNNIATVAQEKIEELEARQISLQKQAEELDKKQKLDMKFSSIKTRLDNLRNLKELYVSQIDPDLKEKFDSFTSELNLREQEYRILYSDMSERIINELEITGNFLQVIEQLELNSEKLTREFLSIANPFKNES